jgi:DNA-binding Lrp family transcriptional regulator
MLPNALDDTDRHVIAALRSRPRAGVSELSRNLGLARGTVQARIDKLTSSGVITGFGPDIDPAAAGYDVRAFTTLSIAQGHHDATVSQLAEIPEVIEVHTVTGGGDLLVKVVASSNDHLHTVLQQIASIPQISHTETHLALATPVQRSVADLVVSTLATTR